MAGQRFAQGCDAFNRRIAQVGAVEDSVGGTLADGTRGALTRFAHTQRNDIAAFSSQLGHTAENVQNPESLHFGDTGRNSFAGRGDRGALPQRIGGGRHVRQSGFR